MLHNLSIFLQLPTSKFDFILTTLQGPHGKHSFYFCRSLFTAPLPSNRRTIVPHVWFCRNIFSDPLPSSGYTCHSILNFIAFWISPDACFRHIRSLFLSLLIPNTYVNINMNIWSKNIWTLCIIGAADWQQFSWKCELLYCEYSHYIQQRDLNICEQIYRSAIINKRFVLSTSMNKKKEKNWHGYIWK
jgi:hypothetical protein